MASRRTATAGSRKTVVVVDPEMMYARKLHHDEKHSGWHIFKSVFWAIYLFVVGVILYTTVPSLMGVAQFFGWSLIILAIFLVVFGFSKSLHLKLMKRYA